MLSVAGHAPRYPRRRKNMSHQSNGDWTQAGMLGTPPAPPVDAVCLLPTPTPSWKQHYTRRRTGTQSLAAETLLVHLSSEVRGITVPLREPRSPVPYLVFLVEPSSLPVDRYPVVFSVSPRELLLDCRVRPRQAWSPPGSRTCHRRLDIVPLTYLVVKPPAPSLAFTPVGSVKQPLQDPSCILNSVVTWRQLQT